MVALLGIAKMKELIETISRSTAWSSSTESSHKYAFHLKTCNGLRSTVLIHEKTEKLLKYLCLQGEAESQNFIDFPIILEQYIYVICKQY